MSTASWGWTLHGDGKTIAPGAVVAPEERLSWSRTIGIGMQHVIAMFGATLLVPTLTGFPVNTTLLFSGISTMVFLLITRNRLPSYLGSSFGFIAPLMASQGEGIGVQLGGVVATGLALILVGFIVKSAGRRVIDLVMPPAVTGAIVALIGLILAPSAAGNFQSQPLVAVVTLASILLFTVAGRGMVARLGILIGVIIGWVFAAITGNLAEGASDSVREAAWIGFPQFHTPEFTTHAILVTLPVVIVLIAENVGHVKAVSEMTGRNLDDLAGDALIADGIGTTFAGAFGGSGTTTYAENIGVMAATKVYSTAAYWVAALTAVVLAFIPKFGALIFTIPTGVLGGAALVLYGLIGMLGVRIWQDNKVNFNNPVNLTAAAVALIAGIGNLTLVIGGIELQGIAWGSMGIIVFYPVLKWLYLRVGEGNNARF
ncbi:uracil-xanthine permease family protein [Corynebacterium diphtheriae]|uniref:Nitrate reductase n=1 Tax=Corynebacterium diphtheriae bv. gravis TaxID=1720349 RepID=A0AAX0IZZ4_CORDP|nr:solute carrier family 23 protein [Corynebacterium diphtheriae]ERA54600.1 putative transport membrane protein [Corynebacterium diphtheriae DSM 43988]AEX67634.1 putative transport membrane protein [Corynebacterium diphtheriae C7 (beta)]OKY21658.1 nitrate reductase [Corynebacterium diphtheriae bv. gravis]UEB35529.1 NCS2 family nucleobase:cation symporter [Corynebacterium diphtheriae subsp. diphtheriae]UEB42117.1 NCS2 family nucleobase:cation symporter [Corynebacterium diphtheriae]